jgi:hypothetical protein
MKSSACRSTYKVTLTGAPSAGAEGTCVWATRGRSWTEDEGASGAIAVLSSPLVMETSARTGSVTGIGCRGGGMDRRARSRCALKLAKPLGGDSAIALRLDEASQAVEARHEGLVCLRGRIV